MLTIILLATIVPILTGVAYVALRNTFPQRVADIRGIALQTVIVIVVLLAIAGAVAGVLISRGNETVARLEGQDLGVYVPQYATQAPCENAGFVWDVDGRDDVATTLGDNGCYTE